jgi:hypothetical protein
MRLLVILTLLLTFNLKFTRAQDYKQKLKSNKAFVSIAFQDIEGRSINATIGKQLEKSYAAFGDKTVLTSIILKDFFLANNSNTQQLSTDTNYISLLSECPKICLRRLADPYLLCLANFLDKLSEDTSDFSTRYNAVLNWQRAYLPNAPFGLNEPPEGKSEREEMEWGIAYTKKWMTSYPSEYRKAIIIFNRNFNRWKSGKKLASYEDYLRFLVAEFTDEKNFTTLYYIKEDESNPKSIIPSESSLNANPSLFITEMYENILLRKPDPSEMEFLINFIKNHPGIKPELIFFSLMTSMEYKYF